jgi:prepilin-type N-terminal cleavage/methylation domain-containing protein
MPTLRKPNCDTPLPTPSTLIERVPAKCSDWTVPCRARIPAIRQSRGFTLVELVVTVAVIGILAAVAFPSYQDYLKRSNRSSAQSLMLDLANREQQYLLDNRIVPGRRRLCGHNALPTASPQRFRGSTQ